MKLTYKKKRSVAGFLFVLPWIIGLLIFFAQPMWLLVKLSFTNMQFGKAGGYVLEPLKGLFDNFKYAFAGDAYFPTYLFSSFGNLFYEVPFIVLFSLFSASVLNQKFHGRTVMRLIFFLPIVIGCGLIMNVIQNGTNEIMMTSQEELSFFNAEGLTELLLSTGLPEGIITVVSTLVTNVSDLVWRSALQILVFLVALLSVPESYYEVARVEGAKAWETFWKVTFPTVTPYVLALTIYTIIDSFANVDNKVLGYIVNFSNNQIEYSKSAAMSIIFFFVAVVLLLIVFFIFKPFVFEKSKIE